MHANGVTRLRFESFTGDSKRILYGENLRLEKREMPGASRKESATSASRTQWM